MIEDVGEGASTHILETLNPKQDMRCTPPYMMGQGASIHVGQGASIHVGQGASIHV
eukprot:CAMPEP_0182860170 /NCGR_PEP_ID=MMETSP0034_2-20130328/4761_1 /TAXON_ID=156128 /ORGANISM="Nephroselmis pyriformis, Strain CCMP717" /LENGTH=55 /DNA_ID=CAMNT_0024991927 /DNA_START=397 /DNA_END=560 /DNA_ORIENTATION=-